MGRRLTPETSLKKTCREYLYLKYGRRIWMVNIPGSAMIRSGTPDTLACLDGVFLGIEFKNGAKGRLSQTQEDTLNEIKFAGGNAIVIRSTEDCIEYFQHWK
jgi:Holliday junction resolvase